MPDKVGIVLLGYGVHGRRVGNTIRELVRSGIRDHEVDVEWLAIVDVDWTARGIALEHTERDSRGTRVLPSLRDAIDWVRTYPGRLLIVDCSSTHAHIGNLTECKTSLSPKGMWSYLGEKPMYIDMGGKVPL